MHFFKTLVQNSVKIIKILPKQSLSFLFCLLIHMPAFAQKAPVSYKHAQQPPTADELMQWHETFTYEVSYSFFTLGTVTVDIVSDTLYDHKKAWDLRTVIISNADIPLVGHEENHYNSIFRVIDDAFQTLEYWTDNIDENEFKTSQYIFDRNAGNVYAHEKDQPTDTLALEEPASSGHILFYEGRLTAGTDSVVKMPIYLNQEKKYMIVMNTPKKEKRKYDAFPREVETYYSKGTTDIDGPFGFSGEFESWYLADDLRVPVEARVKVWLGHAKIKLIDYKKERRK